MAFLDIDEDSCPNCGHQSGYNDYVEFPPAIRKAQKEYECFDCKRPIPKGEKYRHLSGLDEEDKFYSLKKHIQCPRTSISEDILSNPILTIITNSDEYRVYADGRIEGIPPETKIINLIPLIITDLRLRCGDISYCKPQ